MIVQGGKAGGEVAAPIASKIIEESLALERGYDPDLKPSIQVSVILNQLIA